VFPAVQQPQIIRIREALVQSFRDAADRTWRLSCVSVPAQLLLHGFDGIICLVVAVVAHTACCLFLWTAGQRLVAIFFTTVGSLSSGAAHACRLRPVMMINYYSLVDPRRSRARHRQPRLSSRV
jgi:hypothetical protein